MADAGKPASWNRGLGPRVCPGAPRLIDWRVWGMTVTMKALGNKGYYFDVGYAQWCNNTHYGCVQDRRPERIIGCP